ncbi:MAG: ABC transporter ATP-binding protein [Deltaproteobacteria bacterium]|nr:ABC transporter ATP-binding protein [Deltaproteobacteria bacterium]
MSEQPFLRLDQVHKRYRLGETVVHALRGVSFDLAQGAFTAVVGPSGSGKSTLLHLVGCLDEPDEGRVLLQGQDVARLSDDARSRLRNRHIGFIFQSFNLVPVLDVYENVELPLLINPDVGADERRERVLQAVRDVELEPQIHQLPDKLSGGQRQRVAIARALVTHPLLVVADEPTANLDSATTHRLIDLLLELNDKRRVTFLFSTHDEKLMGRVAHVLHLKDGALPS